MIIRRSRVRELSLTYCSTATSHITLRCGTICLSNKKVPVRPYWAFRSGVDCRVAFLRNHCHCVAMKDTKWPNAARRTINPPPVLSPPIHPYRSPLAACHFSGADVLFTVRSSCCCCRPGMEGFDFPHWHLITVAALQLHSPGVSHGQSQRRRELHLSVSYSPSLVWNTQISR